MLHLVVKMPAMVWEFDIRDLIILKFYIYSECTQYNNVIIANVIICIETVDVKIKY